MSSLNPELWLATLSNQSLYSCCLRIRPGYAGLTGVIMNIKNVTSKSSESKRHFQARCTRITSSHTSVNWRRIVGKKLSGLSSQTKFPVLFALHINLRHEQHLTETYSSFRVLWYITTSVTQTNAQFCSLYILSIAYVLHVSALSLFSGSLHQAFIET